VGDPTNDLDVAALWPDSHSSDSTKVKMKLLLLSPLWTLLLFDFSLLNLLLTVLTAHNLISRYSR